MLSAMCVVAAVTTELRLQQYDGPLSCTESKRVRPGRLIAVQYNETIDASSKSGTPGKDLGTLRQGKLEIGIGNSIAGWDQGLLGLCEGAKVTLVVPPSYAYGDKRVRPDIPPLATLHFDLEVQSVGPPPSPETVVELLPGGGADPKHAAEVPKPHPRKLSVTEERPSVKDGMFSAYIRSNLERRLRDFGE